MSVRDSDVMRWFPDADYYRNHSERISSAFNELPELPTGFKCLCIGTWGAEVPYLMGHLGASEVRCVRAPDENVPKVEQRTIDAPGELGSFPTTIYAMDIESEALPEELISTFDLVLAWEVLEHLCVNPPNLIWQAVSALRNGGIISVTTPNALWHYFTTAQLFGDNALGLKLQPHKPFATHWRLYSPREVGDLCTQMGCELTQVTSFLKTEAFSLKSRLYLAALKQFRKRSGNGDCNYGQVVHVIARKTSEAELYRPEWLFPATLNRGGAAHL